jgi:lysine/ornithine N-monooxygenase
MTASSACDETSSCEMPNTTTTATTTTKHYDFCIIGSGPAGLAALSALRESYTLGDGIHLNDLNIQRNQMILNRETKNNYHQRNKRICVIDPHPNWMDGWKNNFDRLDIKFLRSPVLAHPDAFDPNSLLAYAYTHHRQHELQESDCSHSKKLQSLGESQIGLWDLPSTSLFNDFCVDLSKRLQHDYICGNVIDIIDDSNNKLEGDQDDGEAPPFRLTINNKKGKTSKITANAVILALGTIGKPIIPRGLKSVPNSKVCYWQQLDVHKDKIQYCKNVLVVGGGLTAIQTAQYALANSNNTTTKVILCSRRRIQEKAFDVANSWFDRRHTNRHISNFYHASVEERLRILKDARNGGSVPSMYMNAIQPYIKSGRLEIIEGGEVIYNRMTIDDENDEERNDSSSLSRVSVTIHQQGDFNKSSSSSSLSVNTSMSSAEFEFDLILLATGVEPDCNVHPLIQQVQKRYPIDTIGGFPCITEDLQFPCREKLCVVGSLSSLNTGPDAANLMGIKRSANIVANTLNCRSWLRDEGGNENDNDDDEEGKNNGRRSRGGGGGVLTNQFRHLQWSDDESSDCSSDSDQDEEKDCHRDLLVVE